MKYFNDFFFLSFMTKVDPNKEMKQNQKFFHGAYSNLTPYVFYQKILKYFNDLQNQNSQFYD